ncbi:hypothetical protein [Clostridium butyricum]
MSKIIKIYFVQLVLLISLLCSTVIEGRYFYVPVIIGILASVCSYYTLSESYKKYKEFKEMKVNKEAKERRFYDDLLEKMKTIAEENSDLISKVQEKISSDVEQAQKKQQDHLDVLITNTSEMVNHNIASLLDNNNQLVNKIISEIIEVNSEMKLKNDEYNDRLINTIEEINKKSNDLLENNNNKLIEKLNDSYNLYADNLNLNNNKLTNIILGQHEEVKKYNDLLLTTMSELNQNQNNVNENNSKIIADKIEAFSKKFEEEISEGIVSITQNYKDINKKLEQKLELNKETIVRTLVDNEQKNEENINQNFFGMAKILKEQAVELKSGINEKLDENNKFLSNNLDIITLNGKMLEKKLCASEEKINITLKDTSESISNTILGAAESIAVKINEIQKDVRLKSDDTEVEFTKRMDLIIDNISEIKEDLSISNENIYTSLIETGDKIGTCIETNHVNTTKDIVEGIEKLKNIVDVKNEESNQNFNNGIKFVIENNKKIKEDLCLNREKLIEAGTEKLSENINTYSERIKESFDEINNKNVDGLDSIRGLIQSEIENIADRSEKTHRLLVTKALNITDCIENNFNKIVEANNNSENKISENIKRHYDKQANNYGEYSDKIINQFQELYKSQSILVECSREHTKNQDKIKNNIIDILMKNADNEIKIKQSIKNELIVCLNKGFLENTNLIKNSIENNKIDIKLNKELLDNLQNQNQNNKKLSEKIVKLIEEINKLQSETNKKIIQLKPGIEAKDLERQSDRIIDNINNATKNYVSSINSANEKTVGIIKNQTDDIKKAFSNNDSNTSKKVSKEIASAVLEINKITKLIEKYNESNRIIRNNGFNVKEVAVDVASEKNKEYFIKDESGVKYFKDNKLIKHESDDGSITEFKYDENIIIETVTKKNRKILNQCLYKNGTLNEGKFFENGKVKEHYFYYSSGEIRRVDTYTNKGVQTVEYYEENGERKR